MIKILLPSLDSAKFLPVAVKMLSGAIACKAWFLRLFAGLSCRPDFHARTLSKELISAPKYKPSSVIEIYVALTVPYIVSTLL